MYTQEDVGMIHLVENLSLFNLNQLKRLLTRSVTPLRSLETDFKFFCDQVNV